MNSIPNCKSRQGLAENQILKSDPLRSIGDIFCKDLCSRQVDSQVLKQTFSRPKNLVSPTWRKTSAKRRSPRIGFQGPHDVRRLHDDFQSPNPSQQPLKPSAKIYRKEVLDSIVKSWPEIEKRDVRRFSPSECITWAAQFSNQYSATRYNGASGSCEMFSRLQFKLAQFFAIPHRTFIGQKSGPKCCNFPTPDNLNFS
jgi:hypothetical protein